MMRRAFKKANQTVFSFINSKDLFNTREVYFSALRSPCITSLWAYPTNTIEFSEADTTAATLDKILQQLSSQKREVIDRIKEDNYNLSNSLLSSVSESVFWKAVGAKFNKDAPKAAMHFIDSLKPSECEALHAALSNRIQHHSNRQKSYSSQFYNKTIFDLVGKEKSIDLLDQCNFDTDLPKHDKLKKLSENEKVQIPVSKDRLITLALVTGVPFIGFGFLDNFIMISAGESIDQLFGMTLGLSTMVAAALGNMMSDIAGICFAESIEAQTRRFKYLRIPKLSNYQKGTYSVRIAKGLGSVIGVSIGCILGMIPLLWFEKIPIPS